MPHEKLEIDFDSSSATADALDRDHDPAVSYEVFDPREAAARLEEDLHLRVHLHEHPRPDADATVKTAVYWLYRMVMDSDAGRRPFLSPRPQMSAALDDLSSVMPNSAPVVDLVAMAVRASMSAGLPIRLPPLMLVGPSGVGKSIIARKIANLLGGDPDVIDCSRVTKMDDLGGMHRTWRDAGLGRIAMRLVTSSHASPHVVLDGLDLTPDLGDRAGFSGALHALLDPERASQFKDRFLNVVFAADRCGWIATAETLSEIPRALRDHFVTIHVAPPSRDQKVEMVRAIFGEVTARDCRGRIDLPPSDDVLARLIDLPPSAVRIGAMLTCQSAMAASRRSLTIWDAARALSHLGRSWR